MPLHISKAKINPTQAKVLIYEKSLLCLQGWQRRYTASLTCLLGLVPTKSSFASARPQNSDINSSCPWRD